MFRWLGAILIVLAGGGIGYSKSLELEHHLIELKELEKIFCLLRSELKYTKAPFAEIFEKIGSKVISPYREWILKVSKNLNEKLADCFWDIWNASIEEELMDSRLKEDELKELKEIGKQIEYSECLDIYIEQMEYHTKQLREEYRTKKKIYQSLGVMGGIFLAVMLL